MLGCHGRGCCPSHMKERLLSTKLSVETVGNMQRVIKQLAGTRLNLATTLVHGVMLSCAAT